MKRRVLAICMAAALCVGLLPTTILAETGEYTADDAVESKEETDVQVADIEIAGDGTATIVLNDDEKQEENEEEADDTGQPAAAELEGEAEAAEAAVEAEEEEAEPEEVVYTAKDGSVSVKVTAPYGALPEDAELEVERFAKDSKEYKDAAEAIGLDADDDNMAALDISFKSDGKEVEPSEAVKVSIDVSDILPEDADASTLEVQHLVETPNNTIKPVVVANESSATEGKIDEDEATAEFEVSSFSTFTVSWTITNGPQAGSSYTVNVTAYLDGTELDITNGLTFSSENDELDFETLLSDLGYGSGDYTFSYAIGTIGNVTYGSEDIPIAAVEIVTGTGTGAGGGQTTYFRIVYMDGSYVDVATSSDLNISAYYTTPSLSVEIVAVDEDEAEDWQLKAVVSHAAEGSTLSYEWWITDTDGDDTELAYVTNTDNTGQAFIVWSDDVEDNDEVVVHVRVTETDASGDTKTAEASYTLEYGDETVDLIMTYGPNQIALPAGVTVTLTNIATGESKTFTTSDDGWVHDAEIEPGIYIVSATYTVDGSTYQCNTEISLHDAGNYSINLDYYNPDILTSVPDKDDWEHIDIKLSIGTSGSASAEGVTLDITSATIYTSTGDVRATTTSVTGNDNEFQLHWSTGDGNTHSTSFSSTDYIVINYTLTENGVTTEYSITIGPDTVYASGTTYPVDGQRAYKLYNYLYGTSYESDAQLIAAGIGDIDISGMSLFLVAAILCDSSEVTGAGQLDVSSVQAGLDFALSINTINELATSWQFEVEKTYYNASMLASNFEFVLYDATANGDTWTQGNANSTLTNSQAGIGQSGYSQDTMESLAIAYSDEDIQDEATYYYILSETPNTVTSESGATITFDETVFGIKVQLGKEGEGDDEAATVTVTYYILTGSNGTYTAQEYTGDKIDINSETGEPTFKFENSYQEYVDISGTKVWVDNNDAYSTRPESITISLLKNGSAALDDEGNPITVTVTGEGDTWNWSFENLPVWDGITENVYSVSETITGDDYEVSITQDEDTGAYTITNTLTGETEISVEKTWANDSENKYETRPENITVTITGSDESTYTLTLNDGNSWSATQGELPLYDSTGTEITYTVVEAAVAGYTTDTGDLVYNEEDGTYSVEITNTLETVDVEGEKTWDDDDVNGNRPESITITLLADGEEFDSLTVEPDADGKWAWSFTGLPKYQSDGETEVVYTITEDAVTGYDTVVNGYDVTNTTQKTDITVVKVWNDDENRDGTRTDSVQVQLKADEENVGDAVELKDEDDWTYTWSNLPVYVDGEKVTYTVEEVEIPAEYTASYSSETDEDGNMTFTMVNTHEDALTQITVNKEWQDADNENGTRPDEVTVQLMANGAACGDAVTLDESNNWSYTWEELYSFEDGELIDYTVEEIEVDGYNTDIGDLTPVYDDDNNLTGYTITVTNTRTGETEIGVEKIWDGDSDNQYETRPDEITVTITGSDGNSYELTLSDENDWSDTLSELPLYDSEGAEITYEVTEETVTGYDGEVTDNEDDTFTITNILRTTEVSGSKTWLYDSEADRPDSITIYLYADGEPTGDSVTVTANDDWSWNFSDIPIYNKDGEKIVYTVQEGEIEDYIPSYDGMDVENALPEVHKYVSDPTFGESTDDDLKEDEGENHNTLEYKLEADHIGGAHDLVLHDLLDDQLDIESLVIKEVILYADEDDSGRTLEEDTDYTVTKGECTADCGLDDCTFEIHVIDEDVQDLTSDAYIIVIYDIDLNEDVEDFNDDFVDEIINHVGLSFFATFAAPDEADTYSYGFDLYKYATDTEDPLEGAEFILAEDGDDGTVYAQFEVTDNTYLLTGWGSKDDATTIVTGSDGNAVVEGLHDGTFILTETKAPDGYAYTKQDTTIVISVEDDYSDPTITVDGEEAADETARIANAPADEEQIPEKAVSIDDDDAYIDEDKEVNVGDTLTYEIRYYNHYADEVTVTITDCLDVGLDFVEASDGGTYDEDSRTITWTIENAAGYTWGSVTFTVTVNEAARNANEIENTASVKINGSDAQDTNKVENPVPETRDISGSKTWDDDNDKADARPGSITVRLYQNGELYKTETVTAVNGWAWSWTDLPRYDEDGNAYAYTIDEDTVEYYTPTYYDGNFNITNTFVGEEGAEQPPTSGPNHGGDVPKTGDTSNVGVWLALLIAAMACALVAFRMRKRS